MLICVYIQCFVDHVLTCVLAFTIICSHMYLLRWSHTFMFTCFDIHMLLCSHALMIISTCLYALMLICLDTFMIGCSFVNMLRWSHAFKFIYHDDRVLPHLHTLVITCPLTCMPSSLYAWTLWCLPTPILKCFNDRMLTCIDIHMFDIHTHVHTLG